MQTSLIIPAYNEEHRIGGFLQSIVATAAPTPHPIPDEIIVVNDGSSDDTNRIVREFQHQLPQISVIEHKKNQGKGAAVRTGVLAAQGDHIIFMDADGATPITELPKMLAALRRADMAVGNRWLPGAQTTRHSTLRRLSGFTYRSYMRLFGIGHIDTMCGFKGFQRRIARSLFADLRETGWLFDTEICYRAVQQNVRIVNVPITWESKDGSKLNTKTLLTTSFKIWPLIHQLNKSITPARQNKPEGRGH